MIIVGIVLLVVGLAALGWHFENKRIEALREAAGRIGLDLVRDKDRNLGREFQFLEKLRKGQNRYAEMVMRGTFEGEPILAFEYHYETSSTDSKGKRSTRHHHLHVLTARLRRQVPEVMISPESVFSKVAQAFATTTLISSRRSSRKSSASGRRINASLTSFATRG